MEKSLKGVCPIISFLLAGAAFSLLFAKQALAQEGYDFMVLPEPLESQYFHNRYLGNPAMAGLDTLLHLEASYRKQWTDFPGAPVTKALTADYNPGKRVGLGLIMYSDKAALLSRNRVALTYAYHLPAGEKGQQLHFGISGAFAQNRLDLKNMVGNENDPAVAEFNGPKHAFELDYGMAYTDTHLTVQASLTDLVSYFKHSDDMAPGLPVYYAAAAYRFFFDDAVNVVEPQLSLRGAKRKNAVFDLGVQVTMLRRMLYFYSLYHSSGGFSVGAGLSYKGILTIQGTYLTRTGGLKNYTDENYEIDLGLSLFKK